MRRSLIKISRKQSIIYAECAWWFQFYISTNITNLKRII